MKNLVKLNIHIFTESGDEIFTSILSEPDYTYDEIKETFVNRYYPDCVDFYIEERSINE